MTRAEFKAQLRPILLDLMFVAGVVTMGDLMVMAVVLLAKWLPPFQR